MDTHGQTSAPMGGMQKGTGLRQALRRWTSRLRVSSSSTSAASTMSASTTRPPTPTSLTAPTMALTPYRMSPAPSIAPPPNPATLFVPTTETFIHSPADPRNQPSRSNWHNPPATLKKSPPLSRRNTAPPDYLNHLASMDGEAPMGMVTTIAGPGNQSLRKRRSSRFRLSISKGRGPIVPPVLNSPSTSSFFDRSSSRATQRFDKVEEVGELTVRKRADTKVSDPESLVEEEADTRKNEKKKRDMDEGNDAGEQTDDAARPSVAISSRAPSDNQNSKGLGRVRSIRVVEIGA